MQKALLVALVITYVYSFRYTGDTFSVMKIGDAVEEFMSYTQSVPGERFRVHDTTKLQYHILNAFTGKIIHILNYNRGSFLCNKVCF